MSDEDGDRRPFETESDSPRSSASDARSTLSVMDYLDGEEELYDHREHHDADDEMSDSDYYCSLNLNDIPMQDVSEAGIGAKEQPYIDRAPQVTTAEVEMKPHGFDSVVQGAKDKFTENVEDAGQIKAENTLPDRNVKSTPDASFCDGGHPATRPIPKITPAMLEKLRRPEPGAANAASQDETRSVFTSPPPIALTEMQKKLRSHDADSFHDVGCSRNAVAPEAETMDNKSEWLTGRIKQEHFDPSPFGRGLSSGKLVMKLHQKNEPNFHAVAFDAVNRAEEQPSNYPLPQFTTSEIEKKPDGFDKFANGSQEKVKENFGDTGLNGIPNTSPDRTVGGTSEAPFHDGGSSVRKPCPKITPAMLEKIRRPEPVASQDASTPNVKDSLDAFSCGKSRSVSSSAPITPLTEMQKKLRSHSLVAPLDPGRFRDALRMSLKKKLEKRTGPEAPSVAGLDAGGQPGNNPIHQVATTRIQKKPHGFDYVGEGAKVKIKNSVGQNEIGNTPADWPMEGTPDASFHDGGRSAHRPIPKITPKMLEKLRKPDPAASRDVGCFKMKNEPSVHAVGEYSHEDDAEEQFFHKKASAGDVFHARYLANKRRMRKAAENSIHDDDGPSLPKRSRKKNKSSMEGIKIGSEREACGEERFPRPIDEALEEILIEKGEDLEEMEAEGTLSALKNLKLSEEGDSDAVIPDEDVAVADLIPQIKRKVTVSQSSSSSDEDEGASSNDTDEDWRPGQRKTRNRKRNIALHEEEQAGCSVLPKIQRTATEATMAQIHWMYGVVTEYSPSGPGKEGDDFFAQVFGLFRDMGMVRDDNLRATYQAAQTRAIEVTKTYFPQWIPRHQRNAQSADETHDEEDQEEDGEDVAVVAGPEMVDEGIHEDSEESGIQEEEEQVDQDLPFDEAFPYEDEAYNSDISSTGIYEEMEQEPLVMPVVDPDQEMAPPDEEHSDMSTAASPVKPMNAVALPKQPKMTVEMIQQIFCKCAFRYFKHLKEKYVKEVRAAQGQSEIHHWKQEFDAIMKGEGGASE